VIHKNESHRITLQRDIVVVILYGSIYTSILYFPFLRFYTGYRYYRTE